MLDPITGTLVALKAGTLVIETLDGERHLKLDRRVISSRPLRRALLRWKDQPVEAIITGGVVTGVMLLQTGQVVGLDAVAEVVLSRTL